jgi:hypothetical protein
MSLQDLKLYLMSHQPGPLENDGLIEDLLAQIWHELDGGADGGMEGYKLKGRMEQIIWDPPVLMFQIERHGGTIYGSVYAELQQWAVDCEKGVASYDEINSKRRLVGKKSAPLKVEPIAKEIAEAIKNRLTDPRLKWLSPNETKILISEVISASGPKQTIEGRRKRFYSALKHELGGSGWKKRDRSQVFEFHLTQDT